MVTLSAEQCRVLMMFLQPELQRAQAVIDLARTIGAGVESVAPDAAVPPAVSDSSVPG
jgi:hypothetical protein